MALINYKIPDHNYHRIRNRIGEIISEELRSQVVDRYYSEIDANVWLERSIPFDKKELPAINVQLASGSYASKHAGFAAGTYTFLIDCLTNSKSEDNTDGDELATMHLGILMGAVRYILEDPNYITLGFERGFIGNTLVTDIIIADPDIKAKMGYSDALNTQIGRILFTVKSSESARLIDPKILESHITQVKLGVSDKGYKYEWGIEGPSIPRDPRYAYIMDNDGNVVALVAGGDTFIISDTKKEIRQQWLEPINYIGRAPLGTLETDPYWKIFKIVVATNGSTTVTSANGVNWSDRLIETYS